MKFTTKESQEICKNYNLGKFKNIKPIKGGLVNHNFTLITEKTEFVIRGIGQKITPKKRKRLTIEFKLMNFLEKNKFPYLIPIPLKNTNNEILGKINNKNFWIYKKLPGKSIDKFSPKKELEQLREMAKTLSTYHKYVKSFKSGKNNYPTYLKWVLEIIKKINPKTNKNKIDKLALKEKDFFKKIIIKEIKRNYSKNIMALHSDLDPSNVLFEKNKIIGIIDFDDLDFGPRARDVAISLRDTCTKRKKLDKNKIKVFLNQYEKINKLSKDEIRMIINLLLAENAAFFAWAYGNMKKEQNNRYKYMKEMSELSHNIIKDFKLIE